MKADIPGLRKGNSHISILSSHHGLTFGIRSEALMLVVVDGINPFYQLDSKGNAIDVI